VFNFEKPDLFNATIEFVGALFQVMNVRALLRDRQIQGVSWVPTLFFWSWGIWNLYFYSHLQQWASLIGGIALTSVNLIWLVMALMLLYGKETAN
jgi:hypothetical protein